MDEVYEQHSLSKHELLMVRLAVACGCLEGLINMEPGESHCRKKRMCAGLREILVTKVALPRVTFKSMELFRAYITAAEEILQDIINKSERPAHILLNLVRYCLVGQPMKETHKSKIDRFFGMWDGASPFPNPEESGDNIFAQIEAGANKLVVSRGMVLYK